MSRPFRSRPALAVSVLLLAGGCSELTALELATIVNTDKTFADHAISLASKKDCSLVRIEAGLTYCREDEPNPSPAVHCYPTLGDVDCYQRPDPYGDRRRKIGINDQNGIGPF